MGVGAWQAVGFRTHFACCTKPQQLPACRRELPSTQRLVASPGCQYVSPGRRESRLGWSIRPQQGLVHGAAVAVPTSGQSGDPSAATEHTGTATGPAVNRNVHLTAVGTGDRTGTSSFR